jgi:uncharacterized protein involved in exopolysaccharide biosynthesis
MTSGYETTAVLKYEGSIQVAGLPPSSDGLGPAADALMRQSVLEKIAEESGYQGSLTSLKRKLGYHIDLMSNTIEITVGGETGEDAAQFARTVTEVFLWYHKERQSKRFEDEIARTRKRIDASAQEGEVARNRYNEFREEHGIADLSTEQHSMVMSAAKLRADSELAASEIGAAEAQVRSLETYLASTPKTNFVSGGTSPERAAHNSLRQELASAKATLSADHPRVQSLQQQVDELGAQLRSGGGSSMGGDGAISINASYQVVQGKLREAKAALEALRERQKGLAAMAENAQTRVESFSEIEGEASALLAEVKVNESLVNGLRQTEAGLEDALRDPPSGFVVLDPGAVPEYPVRNTMKVVVFGMILVLSVGFALLLVLRREFHGLLLETPAEFAFWGRGPVLGVTAWPDYPQGLDELVAGLDDFVPYIRGSLLILGGSKNEARLAMELADRMNDDWFPAHGVASGPGTPKSAPSPQGPLQTPPARHSPRGPLQTPPPAGPYPIGASGTRSVALARLPSMPPDNRARLAHRSATDLQLEAWDGPFEGQALRRAARLATRVVILVRSGAMSALQLNGIQNRVGRQDGIGFIVVGLPRELASLPDRAGNVDQFWRS